MRIPHVELHARLRQILAPKPARGRRHARRAVASRTLLHATVLALLVSLGGSPGSAEEVSREEMRGLDEQVQEIKSDVLGIAAELGQLEEKLLYPSDTQVAVFVSLAEGETFQLDSVSIQIDGEPVAHHIYSFKEFEALQKGGVQRIYTGNVATGRHRLAVSVAGKLPGGKELRGAGSFEFSKDVTPKLVEITLAGRDSGDASIRFGER